MGKIAFLLLILCCTAFKVTAAVNIKTIMLDGKQVYELEVGHFANENNALQHKLKLSSTLKQPVAIVRSQDKSGFTVKIGPVEDYQVALNIKQLLNSETESPPPAQPKPAEKATKPGTRKKLWNLRNADIRAVIAEVSRVTGKNFIIDPRVQGKISIISSKPMSDKELYQVFLSMLQISGYAAIPSGDAIKIVPNIDAKTVSSDLLSQMRNPPQGDDMLVEVIPVQYVPAEQLVPVLRPLMPQWSSISAYIPSNMLILSGRASNIKSLASIIKQVDSSSANGIDIVPLQHTLAMDVANTLKDLVKTQPGSGGRTPTTLAADDRSNSILLSGSRTERIRLRLIISRLDRESSNGANSNTQVVYLNYLRAQDLVPILAGVAQANFSGTVGTTIGTITRPELDSTNPASSLANGTSSTSTGQSGNQTTPAATGQTSQGATPNTTGATTQNEGSTKPTVQIIAEPNTNSIIINAPATLIRILKSVISQLDIKPAQLLIEALVAEVNENDINSLGIEWGSNHQTGNPASFSPGFAIINSQTNIDDFQAQIYALAQQRKANILSTPSVVVLDNRQAKILVGKQVSVASTTYPNNAGGTTTASPYVTFERVNVALHLYVRPQITRGQGIQMQIDQGNDTLDSSTDINTENPIFNISSIVTSVHVESGDIVVLGGLAQDSLANNDNKLPIIGDIPGVGRLFQHNIRTRDKRVLMVFIRPIILRSQKDSFLVTGTKYNDLRQTQLDFLNSQEVFVQNNDETVLPALRSAELPRPFSGPPMNGATMTK
ncbi:GspD family T2SS secretin variant LspD [Legionella spiritensis]|uniref:Type II protein secretion LspD n=1 Tax=Legionella spiritensis TaxID=452 RepID=A0A0W0YXW2_LEGSP|nr:GspD family T2SS secretin variant LspD [Legionella spiritensis]KTD61659.1 type II protein secretion LspD [Legionella spiritensis]SNV39089.1 type II protein secretion LspD [Legionella spiritensis]